MRSILGLMVFGLVSVAVPASAQYAGDAVSGEIAGAVRLHFDVSVLRYLSVTTNPDFPGESDQTRNVLSFGGPSLYSTLLGGGGSGVGLGYALSDSVVIGTTLQFARDALSDPDSPDRDESLLTLGLAPYVQYVGGEGSTKPFIGGTFYLHHRGQSDGGSSADDRSETLLGGGLLGGAYFFVSEGCSIDLTGKFTYGVKVAESPSSSSDSSLSVVDFLVTLGVSAWVL